MSNESKTEPLPFEPEAVYSLKTDPIWTDVTPLEQDDGDHSIAKINYSKEFKETYDYIRAILQSDERSERAFNLTEKALRLNPANYTVWFYRRKLIRDLKKDLDEELFLLSDIIECHPKNYQVWFHRQKIVEMKNDPSGELKFIESMLDEDAKNYHAWQYRQWLLKTFSIWSKELDYVNQLICDDIRNNSAWNQRYFVITHTTDYNEKITYDEIIYTLLKINLDIYNESAWNYLRGITQNLPSIYNYKLEEPFNCTLLQHVQYLLTGSNIHSDAAANFCCRLSTSRGSLDDIHGHQLSPFMCLFAVDCYEEMLDSSEEVSAEEKKVIFNQQLIPMIDRLEKHDDIVRKNYWKFLKLKLNNHFNFNQ